MGISIEHLERIYDSLAESIDAIDPAKREMFLVKLALLSAHKIANGDEFIQLIHQAKVLED